MELEEVPISEHLQDLLENSSNSRSIADLSISRTRYENLRLFRLPTKSIVLSVPEITFYANEFDIEFWGLDVVVLPYVMDSGVKLYGFPIVFYVAYQNPNGFGLCPVAFWDTVMDNYGVDKRIIAKVKDYLNSRKASNYE